MRVSFFCIPALLLMPSLAVAGLVSITNPGFETGDFTGWTQSGDTSFTSVLCSGNVHSGSCYGVFGPTSGLGYIAQNIDTVAGEMYDVTFYARGDGTPNQMVLYWDGGLVANWTNINIPDWTVFGWSNLTASTNSTELKLGFYDAPAFLYVDDVAVNSSIPEPSTVMLVGAGVLLLLLRRRK